MFGDGVVTDCASCKDPVVKVTNAVVLMVSHNIIRLHVLLFQGQLCGKLGCNTKLHPYCASRLAKGRLVGMGYIDLNVLILSCAPPHTHTPPNREVLKCPQCAQPWEHELPTVVEQPLGSTAGIQIYLGVTIHYLCVVRAGPSTNDAGPSTSGSSSGGGGSGRSRPHSKRLKSNPG